MRKSQIKNMNIKEQIRLLEKALEPWAAANAGSVKVANDKLHLFQLLGASPGAPRAAVYFVEERPRSRRFDDMAGRVDRKFWICVSRGRGFNAALGKSLTEGVAGGKPMFALVEEAREEVRGVRQDDIDETRPYYKGTYPINLEDATVDAYYVEVALAADVPQQT
jgi:hypothetical protein